MSRLVKLPATYQSLKLFPVELTRLMCEYESSTLCVQIRTGTHEKSLHSTYKLNHDKWELFYQKIFPCSMHHDVVTFNGVIVYIFHSTDALTTYNLDIVASESLKHLPHLNNSLTKYDSAGLNDSKESKKVEPFQRCVRAKSLNVIDSRLAYYLNTCILYDKYLFILGGSTNKGMKILDLESRVIANLPDSSRCQQEPACVIIHQVLYVLGGNRNLISLSLDVLIRYIDQSKIDQSKIDMNFDHLFQNSKWNLLTSCVYTWNGEGTIIPIDNGFIFICGEQIRSHASRPLVRVEYYHIFLNTWETFQLFLPIVGAFKCRKYDDSLVIFPYDDRERIWIRSLTIDNYRIDCEWTVLPQVPAFGYQHPFVI